MTGRALNSDASTRSYFDFQSEDDVADDAAEEFFPGERMCAPDSGTGGSSMLQAAIVIAVLLGGGWAALKTKAAWEPLRAAVTSMLERTAPAPAAPATPPVSSAAAAPEQHPLETHEVAAVPGAEAGTAAPPTPAAAVPTDATEPEATTPDETAVAPLPPPAVDPADPYQTRAVAVGLHPDLSRALLTRLSPTDFRNAGFAIRTALAETPDDGVFAWPREHQAKLALFEVHFVAGSSPACRRYVVTVTRERWSTTAPPMETCGADLPKRKVAKAAAG